MKRRSFLARVTAALTAASVAPVVAGCAEEKVRSEFTGSREEHMTVDTPDGAKLSVKRYPARGAPILLVHGLAANRRCFDLERVSGSGFEYRSLADELRSRGHDVWLVNLRGVGNGSEQSALPDEHTTWTIDEHIVEDLPAVLEHIRKATGQSPFLLGHSMGGLVIAAYLQGARWRVDGDSRSGVVLDADLAAERAAGVRAVVLVAPALRMKWGRGRRPWWFAFPGQLVKLLDGRLVPDRVPLRKWTLSRKLTLAPRVDAGDEEADVGGDGDVATDSGGEGNGVRATAGKRILHVLLDSAFGPAANRPAILMKRIYKGVIDDCSKPVLRQFVDGIRHETMRSAATSGASASVEPVDYAARYAGLDVPILAVLGGKDRLVDHETVQESFATADGATIREKALPERQFTVFGGYGHVDLLLGGNAPRDVYPTIVEWLRRYSEGSR